ncbi:MAG: hypothetical protein J0M08_11365 [Bacteroidetes bacterium]|nr:hypothetical protein [Bacteroidota bacterium]
MKKLTTILAAATMLAFVACGPSAEEKAAAEKAKQDSIAAAETMAAEAMAAAEKATQDSIAAADAAKAAADSAAAATEKK